MITKRDRKIINFIECFRFITITQCGDLFFTKNKSRYDGARQRLKVIEENGNYIKSIFNQETKERIYIPIDSNEKKIKKHRLMLIDYVAGLTMLGAENIHVDLEKNFGGYKPDAFITLKFDGYAYFQLLEIELRHDYVDINRYEKVMPEILKVSENAYPALVIIQNTRKKYINENRTKMEIYQMNTNLKGLVKVLIPQEKPNEDEDEKK